MTMPSDALADAVPAAPAPLAATRPFYWSLRRELWENRSVYMAPLIVAGVVLFGFAISAVHPPRLTGFGQLGPSKQAALYAVPYAFAAFAIMATAFIVAVFYCLGALHNERRDRSILFWKSLPVSDLITVLAKAAVPFVVIPAVVFVVVVVLHIVMLLLNSASLLVRGRDPGVLWEQLPLLRLWLTLLYGLVTTALWNAPIYGWLLLVSGWARRAPFLWAVLPPLAVCVVEKFAFDTGHFAHMLGDRLGGGMSAAFASPGHAASGLPMPEIDPAGFAATPGLWLGLAVGAAFLAATVWLRRTREPV